MSEEIQHSKEVSVSPQMAEVGLQRFLQLRPDVNVGDEALRGILEEVFSTMIAVSRCCTESSSAPY